MNQTGAPSLPPIVQSVSVAWNQRDAFDRFTARFAEWWPSATHSIGEKRVKRIVFETRIGGRIYEEHTDGRRFQWGQVTVWDPPHRACFTWHPSRSVTTAQDVSVEFAPEGAGTRVTLTSVGWERWGKGAAKARKGYNLGWNYVLNYWAGNRSGKEPMMRALVAVARLIQMMRGGLDASIARAGGEIRDDGSVA